MGELHVITGCMFSGKTTELLRVIKRFRAIDKKILLINHRDDTRYSATKVSTHDKYWIDEPSVFCTDLMTVDVNNYDVIGINEAQFFENLVVFCNDIVNRGKIVFVSGLDGDFEQKPFGELLSLIPNCDSITRLSGMCSLCRDGTAAYFTKRLIDNTTQKLVGSSEYYMAVCRKHLH
jgi:thymidine kinase